MKCDYCLNKEREVINELRVVNGALKHLLREAGELMRSVADICYESGNDHTAEDLSKSAHRIDAALDSACEANELEKK